MRYVNRKESADGCVWYICPHCGSTLMLTSAGADFDLPAVCGHCGRDVYFIGEEAEDEAIQMA